MYDTLLPRTNNSVQGLFTTAWHEGRRPLTSPHYRINFDFLVSTGDPQKFRPAYQIHHDVLGQSLNPSHSSLTTFAPVLEQTPMKRSHPFLWMPIV